MKDRKIKLEARPTFQFLNLTEEFVATVDALLKANHAIKGLKPIQAALDSLGRTIKDSVKPALQTDEEKREIGTSDTLNEEYDKAMEGKKRADAAMNQLPITHQQNLNKLKRLVTAKIEDMSLEELRELGITAKENQQTIIGYTDLNLKLNIKTAELRKITAKIQSHCCGASACNKSDLAKKTKINDEIELLVSLQDQVSRAAPESEKDQIQALKNSLDEARKKIEAIIDGYKDQYAAAQKQVGAATKKISNVNTRIDNYKFDQCRSVSRDAMYNLVHLRARLASFYRLVDKVYGADKSTKAVLDGIISAKENQLRDFNNALSAIYYPAIEGETGLQLYSSYTVWAKANPAVQALIELSEYSPNEYIKIVVPEAQHSESSPRHAPSLGTVNDFFPAAKKKKAVENSTEASASSGLRTSSSSTHS